MRENKVESRSKPIQKDKSSSSGHHLQEEVKVEKASLQATRVPSPKDSPQRTSHKGRHAYGEAKYDSCNFEHHQGQAPSRERYTTGDTFTSRSSHQIGMSS